MKRGNDTSQMNLVIMMVLDFGLSNQSPPTKQRLGPLAAAAPPLQGSQSLRPHQHRPSLHEDPHPHRHVDCDAEASCERSSRTNGLLRG